jgi:hypothetical protein
MKRHSTHSKEKSKVLCIVCVCGRTCVRAVKAYGEMGGQRHSFVTLTRYGRGSQLFPAPAAELWLKEAHLPPEMGNGLREYLDLLRREKSLSFPWESKQNSSDHGLVTTATTITELPRLLKLAFNTLSSFVA